MTLIIMSPLQGFKKEWEFFVPAGLTPWATLYRPAGFWISAPVGCCGIGEKKINGMHSIPYPTITCYPCLFSLCLWLASVFRRF